MYDYHMLAVESKTLLRLSEIICMSVYEVECKIEHEGKTCLDMS